ncbi:putative lipid II flippase FtsW [Euzebya tangerina]|uniref:putative lipid II flippase FtsW n=1 Tax=Euzebya tangerina TaxID=591198 RepID=UPI000E31E30F|nr:putative lipid II flippase FtsW [Euzebya tangerina]
MTAISKRARPIRLPARHTRESLWLIGVSLLLLLLGLVMTFSASFVQSTAQTGDAFGVFNRQAFWFAIGVPIAVLAAVVDYRRWRPLATVALIGTLAAMVLVLFIGEEINGARRWFSLGPLNLQPSEIIKLTLPMYVAAVLAKRWNRVRRGDLFALLLPTMPAIAAAALLVVLSPDLESAVLVAVIGLTPLFIAGLPMRLLAVSGAALGAVAWFGIQGSAYRIGRINAWLDPTNEAFRDGYGYQTTQGFIALGNGGIWGTGLGQGRGKWLYVPNAHTDFIYAIIGEELGLVGGIGVLIAFLVLTLLGCRIASRAPDAFGRMLAAAITVWLALQAAINISSVVGVLPVTGVTLPLVSFGGSSLVITMAGIGVLVAIARQAGDNAGLDESLELDGELNDAAASPGSP